MLHEFLRSHQAAILQRSKGAIAELHRNVSDEEVRSTLPLFLDDVILSLREQGKHDSCDGQRMCREALRHGEQRLRLGFTVSQLVEDYGAVCHAIMDLAAEHGLEIRPAEYAALNRCLDAGIAAAVEAYAAQRERQIDRSAQDHLGFIAHELRNSLATATLSFARIRRGDVDARGRTGAVVDRSLGRLREIIDRSLTEVRLKSAAQPKRSLFRLCDLLDEVEESMAMEASSRDVRIVVAVSRELVLDADQQLLASAVGNLVHNGLKFTRPQTAVRIHAALADDGSVVLEVEDECGGLPRGKDDELFRPYVQRSSDHSGLGLGLAIVQQAVEAHGGNVFVRSVPQTGCVFTIRLPSEVVHHDSLAPEGGEPTSPHTE
jgi:signal transduction histidine kinase